MARISIAAKILLISLLWVPQAYGLEVFSVGGRERVWVEWETTPGGFIDFVDRLGGIQNAVGEQVFVGVADSLSG